MANIIPPRRDEVITNSGEMTVRFAEFLEKTANTTNDNTSSVNETFSQPSLAGHILAKLSELEKRTERIVITSASITANAFETIKCTNSSPINVTLEPNAIVNDIINVRRTNAVVTVIGLIDGLTNKTINVNGFSLKVIFDGTEWVQV